MSRRKLSDEEILAQIGAARERARIADLTEPRAVSARYDRETGRIELELRNGCLFAFPTELVQGLRGASPAQLAAVELWDGGAALHWEELDVDYSVPGLIEGGFGSEGWLEQWGGSGWNARITPRGEHATAEPVRHRKVS